MPFVNTLSCYFTIVLAHSHNSGLTFQFSNIFVWINFIFLRDEMTKSPFFKILIGTLVKIQESHEQVQMQSFQWMYHTLKFLHLSYIDIDRYFILLHIFSDDQFEQAYKSLRSQDHLRY